jgi:Zn-dependent protease
MVLNITDLAKEQIMDLISILSFVCYIPAIVLHEVAHGFVAYKLGDPTAKAQGRLSLNPIKHIDPFGTVILPLLLVFAGGPVFGYAKPVPYNPRYFKNLRQGELMTGLAGPAANLVMGLVGVIAAFVISTVDPSAHEIFSSSGVLTYYPFSTASWALLSCYLFTMVNFFLMFFNLIPIPPLDGSSIIAIFLNDKQLRAYYSVQQYALPVLMVLLIVVPYVLNFSPIGWYLTATAGNLTDFFYGWF